MGDTKKIIEELYEIDPSLKLNDDKVQNVVSWLIKNNPSIKPERNFREKLGHKLVIIGEFKEIQPKSKFNIGKIFLPAFMIMFGAFILLQFNNYLSMKKLDLIQERSLLQTSYDEQSAAGDQGREMSGEGESTILKTSLLGEENITQEEPLLFSEQQGGGSNSSGEGKIAGAEGRKDGVQTDADEGVSKDISIEEPNAVDDKPRMKASMYTSSSDERMPEEDSEAPFESSQGKSGSTRDLGEEPGTSGDNPDSGENDSENIDSDWAESTTSEEETRGSQEEEPVDTYYVCDAGVIHVDNDIDKRKIIKRYCEEVEGELIPDKNIDYYLCKINSKKEVGMDYISRDLCQ